MFGKIIGCLIGIGISVGTSLKLISNFLDKTWKSFYTSHRVNTQEWMHLKSRRSTPRLGQGWKWVGYRPKLRRKDTFWKKWKQFLLVIGGTATTNIVVKVTKGAFALPKRMFCVSSVFFFFFWELKRLSFLVNSAWYIIQGPTNFIFY